MALTNMSLISKAATETLSAGNSCKKKKNNKGTKSKCPLLEGFFILLLREYTVPLSFVILERQCRDPYSVEALSTADYNTLAGEDRHQIVPFLPHSIY